MGIIVWDLNEERLEEGDEGDEVMKENGVMDMRYTRYSAAWGWGLFD